MTDGFKLRGEQTVERFHLESWENRLPSLTAGFTAREGGVSEGGYASLNLALHVGDDPQRVMENRRRLAAALDWPFEAWTCAEQVHGCHIERVEPAIRGAGRLDRATAIADTDGLITNEPGILLTAFYADCVPLYFLDPEHGAVGLAHAGWRGTALNVARAAIDAMAEAFGTNPRQLRAAIGPAIGGCCYEVDDRVLNAVADAFNQAGIERSEMEQIEVRQPNGRSLLDLKKANRQFMIKAGILPEHIEISQLCTSCRPDRFYSHRRDGIGSGRMAAWIGIRR